MIIRFFKAIKNYFRLMDDPDYINKDNLAHSIKINGFIGGVESAVDIYEFQLQDREKEKRALIDNYSKNFVNDIKPEPKKIDFVDYFTQLPYKELGDLEDPNLCKLISFKCVNEDLAKGNCDIDINDDNIRLNRPEEVKKLPQVYEIKFTFCGHGSEVEYSDGTKEVEMEFDENNPVFDFTISVHLGSQKKYKKVYYVVDFGDKVIAECSIDGLEKLIKKVESITYSSVNYYYESHYLPKKQKDQDQLYGKKKVNNRLNKNIDISHVERAMGIKNNNDDDISRFTNDLF